MVSKKWVKRLFEETKAWVNDRIIDSSQQERIIARYSDKVEYSRLINTITTLGSILIGLGILLFVASNWDKLGRPAKISIIFVVISLFHLLGYYFRYVKEGYRGLSEGFILIGAFAFGAGIWLIAQIYQIHYNFSAGIMFWILGILPVAYLYRSWTVLTLSSILSLIWFFSYSAYYPQKEVFGFFILLAVLVALCYIQRQRFPLFVMLVSSSVWLGHFWSIKYFSSLDMFKVDFLLASHLSLATIYMFFGFILYGLGMYHMNTARFNIFSFLYKILGIIFISTAAYSLTFAHHYDKFNVSYYPAPVAILIGLFIITSTIIFLGLHRTTKEDRELSEAKIMLYFLILALLAALVSFARLNSTSLSFNIVSLVTALGFMYLGFIKRSEGIFRLSIAAFFINILSRYFDIFWKMMPRSLLFIFGGILLIVGAVFADRKRREIEDRMRKS